MNEISSVSSKDTIKSISLGALDYNILEELERQKKISGNWIPEILPYGKGYIIYELDFIRGLGQVNHVGIITDISRYTWSPAFGGLNVPTGGKVLKGNELEEAMDVLEENDVFALLEERKRKGK